MLEFNALLTAGLLAGLLRIVGDFIYNYSTWRGDTKPSRVSWLIWVILTYEVLISYIWLGATHTLLVPAIATLMTTSVFVLAIYQHEERWRWLLHLFTRKNWNKLDSLTRWCLVIGLIGIVGWAVFDNPFIALVCALAADLAGATVMLPKALKEPWTENKAAWTFFFTSGLANLFAAEWEWTWDSVYIWTYVTSMFLSDGIVYLTLMIGTIWWWRHKK